MATNRKGTRTRPAIAPFELARPSRATSADTIASNSVASALRAGMLVLALVVLPDVVAAGEKTPYPPPASGLSSAPQGAPQQFETAAQQPGTAARSATEAQVAASPRRAHFGGERVSREARQIADWIVDAADNRGLPFVIVDKIDARIFVFDAGGRIQGAAPALLGLARGDGTVLGIGDREYADMPPETRTTPAGRFVAALGMNTRGEDVVWVDYDAAVDIHRVVTNNPKERRLERLATPTPRDNRISYGCINVSKRFYEKVVKPAFAVTDGIVYVLPETGSARALFGAYDVDARPGGTYAGQTEAPK